MAHAAWTTRIFALPPLALSHLHPTPHKFEWNAFPNNARMENRIDLNLGMVVSTSIIYHIPGFLTSFIEWLWFLFLIAFKCKPAIRIVQPSREGNSAVILWVQSPSTYRFYVHFFTQNLKRSTSVNNYPSFWFSFFEELAMDCQL